MLKVEVIMDYLEFWNLMKRVDASSTLNKNNVIEKVKGSLQEGNPHLYKKWEENDFNIDSAIFSEHEDNTLLTSVAGVGCVKVVNALIERGADVNGSGGALTPLYEAIIYSNIEVIEIVEILIKNGAVLKREVTGYTPLFFAVYSNQVEVVSTLLENVRGIDLNERSSCMRASTPLSYAIHSRYTECSKTLIKHILLYDPEAIKPHYVDGHGEMSEFWDNCQDEVKKMQKEKIDGNITFYDILTSKDENKLARYIRNKNIVEVLEESDYKSEFPVYAGEIENQYQKGIKRGNLLNEGTVRIQNSDIGGKLPEEICRKVAKYLSNTDIQKLNDSASVFRRPS
ncbi:MAG: ankyrin repeat domain-containing protein [Wolbachia sp.]